tara:strand:+ start:101 stop:463 length:363 start_codon:yes stop_codon:yes gene_type:complete
MPRILITVEIRATAGLTRRYRPAASPNLSIRADHKTEDDPGLVSDLAIPAALLNTNAPQFSAGAPFHDTPILRILTLRKRETIAICEKVLVTKLAEFSRKSAPALDSNVPINTPLWVNAL